MAKRIASESPVCQRQGVRPAFFPRLVLAGLTLLIAPAAKLAAQHVFYVDHDGKPCLVRAAEGARPCIEIGGKLVPVAAFHCGFGKAAEYLPVTVGVRNLRLDGHALEAGGSEFNRELHFYAEFEAPYRLKDVFVVLDMNTRVAGKVLFVYEIGRLEPYQFTPVAVMLPLGYELGGGHFQLHVFVDGAEALHSGMSLAYREAALDRMVAARVASVDNAEPKLFVDPPPEYPAKRVKTGVAGQVVLAIRIGTNGGVFDPVIKSASDPAFGEAALTAIRQWRFLPKMVAAAPVECRAEIPIDFVPPKPAKT